MIEMLIGLQVRDEAGYARYRELMTPLLHEHGGEFVVDVRVSEVLRAPGGQPFNRLFTIRFGSSEQLDAFFADPAYLTIRAAHFEPSVERTAQLARYTLTV